MRVFIAILVALTLGIPPTDVVAWPHRLPIQPPQGYCGYQTLPMLSKYVGEERPGGYYASAVEYLDENTREPYKIHVEDGLLFHENGLPIDWERAQFTNEFGAAMMAIFSMGACGDIYLTYHHEIGIFHHSSYLAGAPLASAGEMLVVDGRLLEFTNGSGHYRPPGYIAAQALHRLKVMGADLTMVGVDLRGGQRLY